MFEVKDLMSQEEKSLLLELCSTNLPESVNLKGNLENALNEMSLSFGLRNTDPDDYY